LMDLFYLYGIDLSKSFGVSNHNSGIDYRSQTLNMYLPGLVFINIKDIIEILRKPKLFDMQFRSKLKKKGRTEEYKYLTQEFIQTVPVFLEEPEKTKNLSNLPKTLLMMEKMRRRYVFELFTRDSGGGFIFETSNDILGDSQLLETQTQDFAVSRAEDLIRRIKNNSKFLDDEITQLKSLPDDDDDDDDDDDEPEYILMRTKVGDEEENTSMASNGNESSFIASLNGPGTHMNGPGAQSLEASMEVFGEGAWKPNAEYEERMDRSLKEVMFGPKSKYLSFLFLSLPY